MLRSLWLQDWRSRWRGGRFGCPSVAVEGGGACAITAGVWQRLAPACAFEGSTGPDLRRCQCACGHGHVIIRTCVHTAGPGFRVSADAGHSPTARAPHPAPRPRHAILTTFEAAWIHPRSHGFALMSFTLQWASASDRSDQYEHYHETAARIHHACM